MNSRARLVGAVVTAAALWLSLPSQGVAGETVRVTREGLLDRIHGGWLAQMIGNLQGLPHEFKYNDEPRATLPEFTCGLPNGGRTDDDTDIEWVHIHEMDRSGVLKIPYPRIRELWLANMNRGVWMANKQARKLMAKGMLPPETGKPAVNSFSWYNLSGQFCVEAYGIVAPGMPRAASEMGVHYAHITVWGEPVQAAQYWTTMISLAYFHKGSMEELILESLGGVDPASRHAEMVRKTVTFHRAHPKDWKAARRRVHETWYKKPWNNNATVTNGALVILALLYGEGDYYRTLQLAFALGYDADCNAATAATVLGVRLGYERLTQVKGFKLKDIYKNNRRAGMPKSVKISEQAEQLLRVAERVILANGGRKSGRGLLARYTIRLQRPKVQEAVPKGDRWRTGDAGGGGRATGHAQTSCSIVCREGRGGQ